MEQILTLVLSEQGNTFPFAKWTCYDVGLASGCIARWPGKVKSGAVSDALVAYVDVVPTFLEAAGLERPAILDGRSFVPVRTGAAIAHKERDARYRYIRNLTPDAIFSNAATKDRTFKTWEKMAAAGDANAQRLVHDYQHRPGEELYDCDADSWNRHNLIGVEKLAEVRDELRVKLDAWMEQQSDAGQPTELNDLRRMPKHSDEKDDAPKKCNKKNAA